MTKVYFSWAITGREGTEEKYLELCALAEELGDSGYTVIVPPPKGSATPRELYCQDVKDIRSSQAVVAFLEPGVRSFGVGAELQLAVSEGIPLLAVIEGRRKDVTPFLIGMWESANLAPVLSTEAPGGADGRLLRAGLAALSSPSIKIAHVARSLAGFLEDGGEMN